MIRPKTNSLTPGHAVRMGCSPSQTRSTKSFGRADGGLAYLPTRGTLSLSNTSASLGKSEIPLKAGRRRRVGRSLPAALCGGDELAHGDRVFPQPANVMHMRE